MLCQLLSRLKEDSVRHHVSQTVQKDGEHAARVQLPLEPLRDVGGAEDFGAQGAKGLGHLHDAGLDAVDVRQVAMKE